MSREIPRILLLHGAGGGGWQWRDWRHVFWAAGLINTLAPDLHPHLDGIEATRLDDYLSQIRIWYARDDTPTVVIGANMGGLLALVLAETYCPRALVLVNAIPPAGTAGWPMRPIEFPDRVPWRTGIALHDPREGISDADRMAAAWGHARWRDESGSVMRALWAGVPVSSPRCPTLVVCCGQDRTVPATICRHLAQGLGAECRDFPHISHIGALLGPEASRVAQTVIHWLRGEATAGGWASP